MNNAHGAPGRTSGRAQPRSAGNTGDHDLLAGLDLEDKVRLLTGADNWRTCPLPAIGLRAMVMSDGPAGVRGRTMDERNPSASLPCPSALGATWDPGLASEVAFALGTEAKSKGVDVLLAPTINVMRTPLGGRGFESFGEDPVLIAQMAVAYVEGLRRAGVAAAAKHYVGNDSETQRWTYDAQIAEHVLRELYLVPFEACVREADLDLVMTGYNMVNGVTMTEHAKLLSSILKDEWGFQGVALSDWHAARSTVATAAAGLDLAMPGPDGPWGGQLTAAVRAGEVNEDEVDAKVLRILRLARRVGALGPNGAAPNGAAPNGGPVLADPALLRRCAAAAFTLLSNEADVLPLDPGTIRSIALIGPNAVSPVTQGGGSATVPPVSVSTPARALTEALAGLDPQTQVTVRPGCVTWSIVPEPVPSALRDPDTGEPGVRLDFRSEEGELAGTEHRTATMFTWWDGLPAGIGWGGRGTISLRARYRAARGGPHVIGAGGVGQLTLTVDGTQVAAGHPGVPADPVEVMVRPGEIRARIDLAEDQEAEIGISLLPEDWPQGPVGIRLGIVPAPDGDAMLREAVEAARSADAAIVVVGSGPATESEGFDRPGLALPGDQDELVRRVAEVNDRTVVVVNAGMPVLMPWADQVAAIGCCWLPGQAMGDALADVLLGYAEPGGRLPVTIPVTEEDCPVLHSTPDQGRLVYTEGLLIGYRGYDQARRAPRFAFGHGLGYTTWEYLSAAADSVAVGPEDDLGLTVMIRNTGSRKGREVVQAYVEPVTAAAGRPVRTLAAFAAATAEPGQTAEVRLTVPARAFARYDETAGAWAWPPGEFAVRIGRSSADLRLSVQVKSLFFRTELGSPGSGNASCRSWPTYHSDMRARAAAACAAAGMIIGCASCTSGQAHPQASPVRATITARPAPLTLPDRALPSPGCSTATAKSPLLSGVGTAMVGVPGSPFGVAVTPDGRWAFVAAGASVEVLRTGPSLAPVKVATIAVPGNPLGATLTRDGRYLLAASGSGALVVSVARAEQGRPDALLGTLTDPANEPAGASGAIEVAVSADGDYAFVTQEDSLQAAVFNLHRALTQGFGNGDFVGTIPLGLAPVGLAVSPDGRWLYATSEVSRGNLRSMQGTLTVIDVGRAETDPATSVVATAAAGCNPVRVITSADGQQVWVTARESDDLLCFSAAALRSDPGRALVAIVRVGEAPVGLMLVRNGSLVVVADSNRFSAPGARSDLSVVDAAAALAGKPAVVGLIPAGGFPREMALEPDGRRLLVTNFASGQLEAVSIPSLP